MIDDIQKNIKREHGTTNRGTRIRLKKSKKEKKTLSNKHNLRCYSKDKENHENHISNFHKETTN